MSKIVFRPTIPPHAREAATASPQFRRWIEKLEAGFDLKGVEVLEVVMFGRRAGFVLARADAISPEGVAVPGVAFLRGDSVAILPVLLTPDGKRHALLVRQARVPIGETDWYEVPAGMLDEGQFVSKAIEEMAEEIGEDIDLHADDLVELWEGFTTPGGSDELVKVYGVELEVGYDAVERLSGRETGNRHEHEAITVIVAPIEELPALAGRDMKSMLAWHGYRDALARGLFPSAARSVPPAP